MSKTSGPRPSRRAADSARSVFADLRRHNEYAARVARLVETRRQRHIEQVLRQQRRQQLHQAR